MAYSDAFSSEPFHSQPESPALAYARTSVIRLGDDTDLASSPQNGDSSIRMMEDHDKLIPSVPQAHDFIVRWSGTVRRTPRMFPYMKSLPAEFTIFQLEYDAQGQPQAWKLIGTVPTLATACVWIECACDAILHIKEFVPVKPGALPGPTPPFSIHYCFYRRTRLYERPLDPPRFLSSA